MSAAAPELLRPRRYAREVRVSRQGRSPVMVGREVELRRLVGLLEAGAPTSVALIAGEAGVGKTRLVQEVVDAAPAGTVILAGQADPGALGRPFELLLDATEPMCVSEEQHDLLQGIGDDAIPFEARVRTSADLVRSIVDGRPALVVFDDLHWADAESLMLFERLAEPDSGVDLLVGTYRPDGLSRRHPASEVLPRLDRRHDVTHVRLHRLDQPEVNLFLAAATGQRPSYRVVEALHARTSGNPYFLEELLAASPGTDLEELVDQPLPWNLAEVVRSQLDELDPEERRVVDAASVLGRRVPFDLLAGVLDVEERDLIATLRKLVGRGFLHEAESDVFGFHHELAREAVEGELLGRERRRLHEAALSALEAMGSPDLAAVAIHALGAGRYDDMVDAARRGVARYFASGSSYSALQLAELGLQEGEDTELRAAAARAAWLVGLSADAEDHATRWLRAARAAGDQLEEARALELLARLAHETEAHPEAQRRIAELEDVVDQLDDGEPRARALAGLSQVLMLTGRVEEAVASADRTAELAGRLGLDDVRIAALVEKGSALTHRSEPRPEGLDLLAEAADQARDAGLLLLEARAMHNLLFSDLLEPPRDVTIARLERMRDAACRAGFDSMAVAAYHEGMAQLEHGTGHLAAARDWMARPERRGWSVGQRAHHRWFDLLDASLALEAGDLDEAGAMLPDEEPPPGSERRAAWACLVAARAALAGERSRVPDLIASAADVAHSDGVTVEAFLLLLGVAHHQGHDVRALAGAGERMTLGAGELAHPSHLAHVEGTRLEQDGDLEGALAAYLAVADPSHGIAAAPYRGTAAVGAGRVAALLGRTDAAKANLADAERLLADWAGWRVDELEQLRRRLGVGGEVAGPDSLTPREREVVALLTEGLTNVEIAERLYISPRTAAVHVSNVLAKLAMSSRAEVAAWAVREGLGS